MNVMCCQHKVGKPTACGLCEVCYFTDFTLRPLPLILLTVDLDLMIRSRVFFNVFNVFLTWWNIWGFPHTLTQIGSILRASIDWPMKSSVAWQIYVKLTCYQWADCPFFPAQLIILSRTVFVVAVFLSQMLSLLFYSVLFQLLTDSRDLNWISFVVSLNRSLSGGGESVSKETVVTFVVRWCSCLQASLHLHK